jgi:hypothetical protein
MEFGKILRSLDYYHIFSRQNDQKAPDPTKSSKNDSEEQVSYDLLPFEILDNVS